MFKKMLLLIALGLASSGCFMAPLAFIGPATSGFSTASIIQSTATSGANYLVKKSTGKTIAEHALGSITKDILLTSYFPKRKRNTSYNEKKTKFLLGFSQ